MTQLIILAGGMGTRLGEETARTPKPLLPLFNSKSILQLLLERYAPRADEVLILAGYKGESMKQWLVGLQREGLFSNVKVLIEDKVQGTAGALKQHEAALDSEFFLINGDSWFEGDLFELDIIKDSSVMAMLVTRVDDVGRYGRVVIDEQKNVVGFHEKSVSKLEQVGLINTGIYLMKKKVVDEIKVLPASLEHDVFPLLCQEERIEAQVMQGRFLDIGIPEALAYARANKEFFNYAGS